MLGTVRMNGINFSVDQSQVTLIKTINALKAKLDAKLIVLRYIKLLIKLLHNHLKRSKRLKLVRNRQDFMMLLSINLPQ